MATGGGITSVHSSAISTHDICKCMHIITKLIEKNCSSVDYCWLLRYPVMRLMMLVIVVTSSLVKVSFWDVPFSSTQRQVSWTHTPGIGRQALWFVAARANLVTGLSGSYLHADSGKNWLANFSRILFLNKRCIVCSGARRGQCSVPEKDFIISLPAVRRIFLDCAWERVCDQIILYYIKKFLLHNIL